MENKYYKPNISELSLNFEYEELISYVLADISNGEYRQISEHCEWLEKKVTLNDLSNILKPQTKNSQGGLFYNLTQDNIRVKVLDERDLESLGFGLDYDSSNIKCFRSSNFIINLREEFHSKFFPDVCIYDTRFIQPCRYFSGRIKNKTELKFILNAIG